MLKSPFFSIVIPTCHRLDALQLCLHRITSSIQMLSSSMCEVIVTDDGHFTSEKMLKDNYPSVKWIQGPQAGPAANRNNGARYAKGKWLIFIDDDCLPDKDLVLNYFNAIEKYNSTKVFEGRTYVDSPKNSLGMTSPVNLTGGYLWACNFAIERYFFLSLNGFDIQFPYPAMEDVDLKLRINNTGNIIIFLSNASVCHPWRKKGGWRKVMEHNASSFLFLKKHPRERERINARYYLKFVTRSFLYETLPGIVKYGGKGFLVELEEHAGFLLMAVKLFFKVN